MDNSSVKSKPIKSLRCGNSQVAIWEDKFNEGEKNFSFQKTYKTKEGEWKQTNFFRSTDLRDLISLSEALIREYRIREVLKKPTEEGKPSSLIASQGEMLEKGLIVSGGRIE